METLYNKQTIYSKEGLLKHEQDWVPHLCVHHFEPGGGRRLHRGLFHLFICSPPPVWDCSWLISLIAKGCTCNKQYYIKVSFKKPWHVCRLSWKAYTHTFLMPSVCKLYKFNVMSVLPSVGTYCNRTWDGWLCWGDSAPGTVMQMCPEYFHDFDPAGEALTHTCANAYVFSFCFSLICTSILTSLFFYSCHIFTSVICLVFLLFV